jgi:nitrite reductase/ring-hydroxylating ferredoxin subunit
MSNEQSLIRVASLAELKAKGVVVVRGAECPIAVFAHEGSVAAVDNRCPHLGFPLHKGSVQDGILTCHWHNARFDLCSGCTFDPFADDVPSFPVEVRDEIVYVGASPTIATSPSFYLRRLREGMEQNIGLIQAKSLLGLLRSSADYREIVREVALFGVSNRTEWGPGLTLLTTVANILPHLKEETAYLALYQGTRQVAADCAGRSPRRSLRPLESEALDLPTLKRWLRLWTEVRHQDGAERTLLTAVHNGASSTELADLLLSAATDRFYADGGHLFDFCNKAFELLDLIGWEHAASVLPTLVPQLVRARGGEEMNAWRHPVDLVAPLRTLEQALPQLLAEGAGKSWHEEPALSQSLLGDDPLQILEALREAICSGAQAAQLSRSLAYAAALRLAHFSTANEVGDWITPLHTFTYCNAVHQAIERCPTPEVVRGVLHGAMSVYLDRFLNVPPARLPEEPGLSDGPGVTDKETDNAANRVQNILHHLDQRHEVDAAAGDVAHYLNAGHEVSSLLDTLTYATAREDLDFHSYQLLEAGIQQQAHWQQRPQSQLKGSPQVRHILLAMTRYLAAQCPTRRAQQHTALIALRLHRGDNLYEDSDTVDSDA